MDIVAEIIVIRLSVLSFRILTFFTMLAMVSWNVFLGKLVCDGSSETTFVDVMVREVIDQSSRFDTP